jgi:hypothetical protein
MRTTWKDCFIQRILNLNSYTKDEYVHDDLEYEVKQFNQMYRTRKIMSKGEDIKDVYKSARNRKNQQNP